jgi:hypothetical protein
VFYYTPKHACLYESGRNLAESPDTQAAQRGNFRSLDDLRDQILAFITYYNRTMAKPIKWTYTGHP